MQAQALNVPSPQPSPPPELSLCPITGKVLGQEDTEEPFKTPNTGLDSDGDNFIGNSDAGLTMVTGEDGTVYQVAGKNEEGHTILIPQGGDGTQQCLYMTSPQTMTDQAVAAANMLSLDPSATDTYNNAEMITDVCVADITNPFMCGIYNCLRCSADSRHFNTATNSNDERSEHH